MSEEKLVRMTVLNDQSLFNLTKRVNEAIGQGWERYEKVDWMGGYYTQTLIKPVSAATDTKGD